MKALCKASSRPRLGGNPSAGRWRSNSGASWSTPASASLARTGGRPPDDIGEAGTQMGDRRARQEHSQRRSGTRHRRYRGHLCAVGPTGVGKTTTTASSPRCVVRVRRPVDHRPDHHRQLPDRRIRPVVHHGKILGVPVHSASRMRSWKPPSRRCRGPAGADRHYRHGDSADNRVPEQINLQSSAHPAHPAAQMRPSRRKPKTRGARAYQNRRSVPAAGRRCC